MNGRPSRSIGLLVLAITVVALLLRLVRLDSYSIWYDEGFYLIQAEDGFTPEMIRSTFLGIPGTPVLLRTWSLVSTSDLWYRLFSVFAGVATVPLTYRLAARLSDRRVGLLTALFLALNPSHITYSQTIRKEAVFLLTIVLTLCFFEQRLRTGRSRFLWLFALVGVLSATIQPLGVPLLCTAALFGLIRSWRRSEPISGWIGAGLLIGGVGFAFLAAFWLAYGHNPESVSSPLDLKGQIRLGKTLLFGHTLAAGLTRSATLLAGALGLFGFVRQWRVDRVRFWYSVAVLMVPVSMVMAASLLGPGVVVARFICFILPLLLFHMAYSLRHQPSPILAGLVSACLLCFTGGAIDRYYQDTPPSNLEVETPQRKSFREVAAFITEPGRHQPGDAIIHFHRSSFVAVTRYTQGKADNLHLRFTLPECSKSNLDSRVLNRWLGPAGYRDTDALTELPKYRRVWFVLTQWGPEVRIYDWRAHAWKRSPSEAILDWLNEHCTPVPFNDENGQPVYRKLFDNSEWFCLYLFEVPAALSEPPAVESDPGGADQ